MATEATLSPIDRTDSAHRIGTDHLADIEVAHDRAASGASTHTTMIASRNAGVSLTGTQHEHDRAGAARQ